MVVSALNSAALAEKCGLRPDQIILSAKGQRRAGLDRRLPLARRALHLPAASRPDRSRHGSKGIVALSRSSGCRSAGRHWRHHSRLPHAPPRRRPHGRGPRRPADSAIARHPQLHPAVTACPGCGRTTSTFFQEMAQQIQTYLREQMPFGKITTTGRRRNERSR